MAIFGHHVEHFFLTFILQFLSFHFNDFFMEFHTMIVNGNGDFCCCCLCLVFLGKKYHVIRHFLVHQEENETFFSTVKKNSQCCVTQVAIKTFARSRKWHQENCHFAFFLFSDAPSIHCCHFKVLENDLFIRWLCAQNMNKMGPWEFYNTHTARKMHLFL